MLKQVQNQLNKIEKLVDTQNQNQTEFLDITEASDFLKLKKSTLYQLVFKRGIPFYKSTKKLLFKKTDLVDWVDKDRVFTIRELERQMNQSIN
jgi:excisionase family DNA binding protein